MRLKIDTLRLALYSFFILFLSSSPLYSLTIHNLDNLKQRFVLETKQIKIPDYPLSLNPSMVMWNDSILFSFRIKDEEGVANQIGLILLDKNFNTVSKPQVLKMPTNSQFRDIWPQDPRLLTCGNDYFIVFNDFAKLSNGTEQRRMFFAKLLHNGEEFYTTSPQVITNYTHENLKRQEKNWTPFDYQGNLMLAYSISPHLVFFPPFFSDNYEPFSLDPKKLKWDWGDIRGGTPALLIDNQYLGFFHSCKYMATLQSNKKPMHHYYMGAYTFKKDPPFEVTQMSEAPIVAKTFYNGMDYPTWTPLRCVFPCGYIHDDQFIWVCYGRQDNELWVVKLDKVLLLSSLVSTTEICE